MAGGAGSAAASEERTDDLRAPRGDDAPTETVDRVPAADERTGSRASSAGVTADPATAHETPTGSPAVVDADAPTEVIPAVDPAINALDPAAITSTRRADDGQATEERTDEYATAAHSDPTDLPHPAVAAWNGATAYGARTTATSAAAPRTPTPGSATTTTRPRPRTTIGPKN